MDKIIPAFETTLFEPTLSNSCADMSEMGIDSLLDEGVFKSIPVVSLLVGIGKTAQNIHDRNLLKQTIKFINTFNEKTISPAKIEKHRKKIKDKPKLAEEELGRVIILLNSNIEIKKSELLAKFYRFYVNEDIDWSFFVNFRILLLDCLFPIYNFYTKSIMVTYPIHRNVLYTRLTD